MTGVTVEQALRDIYVKAPKDDICLHTLEIKHPNFAGMTGIINNSLYICKNNIDPITLRLEPNAGSLDIEFVHLDFNISHPGQGDKANPNSTLSIDNTDGRVRKLIRAQAGSTTPIKVIYRPFSSKNTQVPQVLVPPEWNASAIKNPIASVSCNLSYFDLISGRIPRVVATLENTPGVRT